MTKEEHNEYMRKYRDAHRDEYNEYKRRYHSEHREERNERRRQHRAEHRLEIRERHRNQYAEHLEEERERKRKWRAEHREEQNERARKYKSKDLNHNGIKKCNIRKQSRTYLLSKRSTIPGYEIHHCFGYEDPKKFIYIPKTLHLRIHQFLRDNNIPANSDHWIAIRDMVKFSDEYTYISG